MKVRLAGVLAAVLLVWGVSTVGPLGPAQVDAFTPYYPYPCPFISGGRDFSGNGQEFVGVSWDPRTGFWGIGGEAATPGIWGTYGDIPVPGDYNGDGDDDFAVWRPSNGTWYVQCSSTTNCASGTLVFSWGAVGDIPVPADYNFDGWTDYGVWRPATGVWYVRSGANVGVTLVNAMQFGQYGDCPIPSRLSASGAGVLVPNVWRPGNGTWYRSDGTAFQFGAYGDLPFAMDMDEDGDADFLLFRPSTGAWYGTVPTFVINFGQPGDIPAPRGFTGGTPELIVFRPTNRFFYRCGGPQDGACDYTAQFQYEATAGAVPIAGRSE